MAKSGLDDYVARRCCFWNLAVERRFHRSRLSLYRYISLGRTAVCILAHCSEQCSVRGYTQHEFMVATPSTVSRVPVRSRGVRSGSLLVAVVAGRMASWLCIHSFWVARIGPGDDVGGSIAQKKCLRKSSLDDRLMQIAES